MIRDLHSCVEEELEAGLVALRIRGAVRKGGREGGKGDSGRVLEVSMSCVVGRVRFSTL